MNVLVFAPHNDDEVLGVGGTIRKHTNQGDNVFVCEVTSGPKYKMMQAEAKRAHAVLGVKESFFLNCPVCGLKTMDSVELNGKVNEVVKITQPDVAYIPFIGDMHIDHREVTESVLVALRPIGDYSIRNIYMYETLSETGWNLPASDKSFIPNVWVDISDTMDEKLNAMKCYASQIQQYPHPRSERGIKALAEYRGSTVGIMYAESFMLVRQIIR